jgi:hypothetical protein
MNHSRRNFLKLVGMGGTAALAPTVVFAEPEIDVRGWRFGVWTLIEHYGRAFRRSVSAL